MHSVDQTLAGESTTENNSEQTFKQKVIQGLDECTVLTRHLLERQLQTTTLNRPTLRWRRRKVGGKEDQSESNLIL